jgi:hypothetical protein
MNRRSILLSLCVLLTALPAAATSYQMMSDRDLADSAGVIIAARIVDVEPAPVGRRQVATDYLVEIDNVLKGSPSGSTVVVRVPGGMNADGIGLKIWGAPAFTKGERAILFLLPASDGTYGVLQLMLGAFHERPTLDGRKAAIRDLSEAHAVGNPDPELHREFAVFSRWLLDRGRGIERPADYFLPAGTTPFRSGFEKYAFLMDASGSANRWFRFDQGRTVEWRVFEGGQPGLSLDDTIEAFKVGLKTWNDEPRTDIRYEFIGLTGADLGFTEFDGINTILFDDPNRGHPLEVPGSFDCRTGGVIAVGGPWFFRATQRYRSYTVHESVEADIITNEGTECLFRNNRVVAEEVFTHELGHSLGLGHTDDLDAIMFTSVHNDGRGSVLKSDDLKGIAEFYSVTGAQPTKKPAAPSNLAVKALDSFRVKLTWRDKAKDEGGFSIEAKVGANGSFEEVGVVQANISSISETGLEPGETYFFRLRSYNRKGFSSYSNTVTIKMKAKGERAE